MKHIPMLFSTPMSAALQNGSKTETRRTINPQPVIDGDSGYVFVKNHKHQLDIHRWKDELLELEDYGLPGDIIWVRETIFAHPAYSKKAFKNNECGPLFDPEGSPVAFRGYVADGGYTKQFKQIPAIHMPKVACRKFLKIDAIDVQQLHDITDEDAIAEGILHNDELLMYNYKLKTYCNISPIESYKTLWESINGAGSWAQNPWVYKISFTDVNKPNNFLSNIN